MLRSIDNEDIDICAERTTGSGKGVCQVRKVGIPREKPT